MRVPKDLKTDNAAGADVVVHEAYTQDEEADFVGRQVLELARLDNVKPGSCAVMYRINAQSRALEECLPQAGNQVPHYRRYTVLPPPGNSRCYGLLVRAAQSAGRREPGAGHQHATPGASGKRPFRA